MKRTLCVWFMLAAVAVLGTALAPVACAEGGTWPPIGQLVGGQAWDVQVQGDYAYVAADVAMTVIDISDPTQPHLAGHVDLLSPVRRIAVTGQYAYACNDQDLSVIDIGDPASPAAVGLGVGLGGDITVQDGYAYVTDGAAGLRVVDVSNPANPVLFGSCATLGTATRVAVSGAYAYVGTWEGGLNVISVADPAHPALVGVWGAELFDGPTAVAVSGTHVYLHGLDSLQVLDVSDPAHPAPVGVLTEPGPGRMVISGACLYAAGSQGLAVINISDPAHPAVMSRSAMDANGIAVGGGHCYLTRPGQGLHVVDVSDSAHPLEVGSFDPPYVLGPDLPVSGGYLYGDGPRVIDVSDPTAPLQVTHKWIANTLRGMAFQDPYIYATGPLALLTVIDASDPQAPVKAGDMMTPQDFPDGIVVSGGYAYIAVGFPAGVEVVNISEPTEMSVVGFCPLPWVGATPGGFGLTVSGAYAYFISYYAGLRVVDISNPFSPVEVGHYDALTGPNAVAAAGGYLYIADLYEGLCIIDVADPAQPNAVGHVALAGYPYDVAVDGRYAYVASGEAGLRVVDVGDPANPVEVAYWETQCSARGVAVADGYVYVADLGWGLLVFPEASPAVLSGQVRVQGTTTNIEGATVEARSGGELKGSATTNAKGIYQIPGLAPGVYSISAVKPGYTRQTKAAVGNLAQTAYVNFNLAMSGRLMGQVTDRVSGTPLIGATVTARSGGVLRATATTTAPWGVYAIDTALPAGTYSLSASKAGYTQQGKIGVGIAEAVTTYINFRLSPPPRLKGQVKDAVSGAPIVGATVEAYLGGVLRGSATTTSPWGVYEIYGDLPAGTYVAQASSTGHVTQVKKDIGVPGSGTAYVNFFLSPEVEAGSK